MRVTGAKGGSGHCECKGCRELKDEDSRGVAQEQRAFREAGGRRSLGGGEGSGLAPLNHGACGGVWEVELRGLPAPGRREFQSEEPHGVPDQPPLRSVPLRSPEPRGGT